MGPIEHLDSYGDHRVDSHMYRIGKREHSPLRPIQELHQFRADTSSVLIFIRNWAISIDMKMGISRIQVLGTKFALHPKEFPKVGGIWPVLAHVVHGDLFTGSSEYDIHLPEEKKI